MASGGDEGLRQLKAHFAQDDPRIAQHGAILDLQSAMLKRLDSGAPAGEVCAAYRDARAAYGNLLVATNEGSWKVENLKPWRHHEIGVIGLKKPFEPYIIRIEVEGAVVQYIAGSARTDGLDRIFLDAAIACEIFAFMDEPIAKTGRFSFLGYSTNLAFCVFLIWISNSSWWAFAITLWLVTVPVWGPRINQQSKRIRKILIGMFDAYRILNGSIASIREIRRALEVARDAGVAWPTPLWVLLEDIEARRTFV